MLTDNTATIDSKCLELEEVFSDFYRVPAYQREYVWGTDQVERLLNDVFVPLEDVNFVTENASEYFIGSVVVCPTTGPDYDVIDGQQRLTTLYLLFCAIRDLLERHNEDVPETLKMKLVHFSLDLNGRERKKHKLELQYEQSNEVLRRIVAREDTKDMANSTSTKNIITAFKVINDFLVEKKFNEWEVGAELCFKFYGFLLKRIKLVRITTRDIGSALMLFETINERGKGLDSFDLVKNSIFMGSSESDYRKITEEWKNLSDTIYGMRERPLRFMRYFIMSEYDLQQTFKEGKMPESDVFKWFSRNKISLNITSSNHEGIKFVKRLNSAAYKYKYFLENKDHYGHLNNLIQNINLLGGKSTRQHLIILLAGSKFSIDEFNQISEELEKSLFISLIKRERPQVVEQKYLDWVTRILRMSKNDDSLNQILASMAEDRKINSDIFKLIFKDLDSSQIAHYRMKYLLAKLTQYVEIRAYGKNEFNSNLSNFINNYDIEHIFPQNPNDRATEEFGENEKENVSLRIGNLTLLESSINSSIQNLPFSEKKEKYSESKLLLTQSIFNKPTVGRNTQIDQTVSELQHWDEWNENSVLQRQEMLLKFALKIWLD